MKIFNYVLKGFFIAAIPSFLYFNYNLRYCDTIAFISVAILGTAGIFLSLFYAKDLYRCVKKWLKFNEVKGVYFRSATVEDKKSLSYNYIYRYEVNGKKYEYKDCTAQNSKKPIGNDKKVTVRYNPENPEETANIDYLVTLVSGHIAIFLALLLFLILLVGKYGK